MDRVQALKSEMPRRTASGSSLVTLDQAAFLLSNDEFQEYLSKWTAKNWPVQLLISDHYSAKIIQDNKLFNLITFYQHEWKWSEQDGLLILHKKTVNSEPEFTLWTDLLPNLSIKKTKRGEFLFENASYGVDGLEFEVHFQFTPEEFKSTMAKWVEEGWPVQFLLRDHYGAKILIDNMVLPLMEFYHHTWQWDEEKGLSILFKEDSDSVPEYTLWTEIVQKVPVHKSPQGWLLFDGYNYLQDGLVPVHLWQWKELETSYIFPPQQRPDHCYVDIIAYCWEHEGMQGFGIGTPHGHLAVEFGDDLGNFYCVGQYMDPRAKINTKSAPAATVRAVLMSPDPYMPSRGEKTVHRYCVGKGKEGQENIQLLKKHIESVQDWQRDSETGIVTTCNSRRYQTFQSNCGVFCNEIEQFTIERLGGTLMKIDEKVVLPPLRQRVETREDWWTATKTKVWNRCLLFAVDVLIYVVVTAPWISKKIGVGVYDESDLPPHLLTNNSQKPVTSSDEQQQQQQKQVDRKRIGLRIPILDRLTSLFHTPPRVLFPRRIRVDQLYSPRLRNYSAKLKA